jgi:hypothetical protein
MELAAAHMRRAQQYRAKSEGVALKVPSNVELARTPAGFEAFCSIFNKPPAEHHLVWHHEFLTMTDTSQLLWVGGPNTAVLAPRGPLDLDTRVPTPGGWVQLRDLRVGDAVFDDDGQPTEVLATVNYGQVDCYRVTFSDGTSMVCDDSHRFDVRLMGTDQKGEWRTVTLQEIRQFVTVGMEGNYRSGVKRVCRIAEEGETPWLDTRGYARYQVPVSGAVEYARRPLPLDPYVVGVLIGDGALTTGSVRFHKDVGDLVDRVNVSLPNDYRVVSCGSARGSWSISHVDGCRQKKDFQGKGLMREILEELGLWGKKSHEKFIPQDYLLASSGQRLALLQGLLDTDGTCKKQTGKGGVSFGTSSEQLLKDICELVRSLGGMALVRKPYQGGYKKADGTRVPCRMAYRVGFRFPPGLEPFYSEAKAALYQGPASGPANSGLVRSIALIEPVGKREIGCITVENSQERFLIDGYIVSKNSAKSTILAMFVAWLIGAHAQHKKMLRTLYLGYSLDIARSRSHTIKTLIQSKKFRQIFPMVQLSKLRQSDELWSLDYDYAGIDPDGDDPYSLVAQGLSGSITSRRSQLIVLDDVIKSSESIQNPEVRRKLITNWTEVVQPTLLEGGRAIALGTRFTQADIFGTTFNEKNGWKVVTQRAIATDDHGMERSYWPSMYSLEYLQKLRAEDPISFSYQFQNTPVSQSEIDFPEDWLKLITLCESYDALCVGIDLSSALKERNDWTVMLLAGIIDDRLEMIDYRRMRAMGNLEKIDALCEMLADWGIIQHDEDREDGWFPTDVGCVCKVEAIAYQQSFKPDAVEVMHNKRNLANISFSPQLSWRGDKLTRLRGTFGLFQMGKIGWNRWVNWAPFFSELKNYGSTDNDDCPDALVLAVKGLLGPGRMQPSWGEWGDGD